MSRSEFPKAIASSGRIDAIDAHATVKKRVVYCLPANVACRIDANVSTRHLFGTHHVFAHVLLS